jgi:outer membrane protein W
MAVVVLAVATMSYAEEDVSFFSLGYGGLTPPIASAKVQELGILTAKHGFTLVKDFKPYVGTGLAYSFQPEERPGDRAKFKTGVAGQAGFNYLLSSKSSLNFEYKYLSIAPYEMSGNGRTPPQSLGVGLDIRF